MSITNSEIKKIAKLARIAIDDNDIDVLKQDLNKILTFIEQLEFIKTENIEPMYSVISENLTIHQDKKSIEDIKTKVLSNAPKSKYGYFVVPKVIQ